MDAFLVPLVSNVKLVDVGLIACCLLSIACRVTLFLATHACGDVACGFTQGGRHISPAPSRHRAAAAAATRKPGTALEVEGSRHMRCGSDVDLNINRGTISSTQDSCCSIPVQFVPMRVRAFFNMGLSFLLVGKLRFCCRMLYCSLIDFSRLPLTMRVIVGVNWLSVISNCLTYSLHPSQVLFAFLVCSCDMLVYVIHDRVGGRRAQCRLGMPRSATESDPTSVRMTSPLCTLETRRFSSPERSRPVDDAPNRFGQEGGGDVFTTAGSDARREDRVSPTFGSGTDEMDLRRSNCSGGDCDDGGDAALASITKRSMSPQYFPCRINQPALFLVAFNVMFLLVVLIFHQYHLFFAFGSLAGLLATSGTLFILGCDICTLSALSVHLRARVASPSFPTIMMAAGNSCHLDVTLLPPLDAILNRRLGAYYVMQHVLSFCCSLLYFIMLLGEGGALYSSYVEFMRWYGNTIGQGLLDLMRLLVFWHLLQIGNSWGGTMWYFQAYGVDVDGTL